VSRQTLVQWDIQWEEEDSQERKRKEEEEDSLWMEEEGLVGCDKREKEEEGFLVGQRAVHMALHLVVDNTAVKKEEQKGDMRVELKVHMGLRWKGLWKR